MTPEERELLHRSVALAEDSNSMLRSMQRSMRLGKLITLVYWLFIIGSTVGAYYLIQPYIEQVTGAYGGAKTSLNGGLNSIKDVGGILNDLKSQYIQ